VVLVRIGVDGLDLLGGLRDRVLGVAVLVADERLLGVDPDITVSANSVFERITSEEIWACTSCICSCWRCISVCCRTCAGSAPLF